MTQLDKSDALSWELEGAGSQKPQVSASSLNSKLDVKLRLGHPCLDIGLNKVSWER